MSAVLSAGRWGGIFLSLSRPSKGEMWKLTLGFMSLTIIFQDFDFWLLDIIDLVGRMD